MKQIFTLIAFCFILTLLPLATEAQIQATTSGRHKKEQKRFLKEAKATESAYKDTHLNTRTYTFKKGESARKRVKKNDERRSYKFDEAGKPLKKKGLFRKKATGKQAEG
ncbi:hypothetical protein WG947_15840 [Pontibacter sp. H259]|uniref:hypothetical protein n=1 Tax=Pontibacter sp. H259 TaxID=3133421 RepID=UPI0030C163E3